MPDYQQLQEYRYPPIPILVQLVEETASSTTVLIAKLLVITDHVLTYKRDIKNSCCF